MLRLLALISFVAYADIEYRLEDISTEVVMEMDDLEWDTEVRRLANLKKHKGSLKNYKIHKLYRIVKDGQGKLKRTDKKIKAAINNCNKQVLLKYNVGTNEFLKADLHQGLTSKGKKIYLSKAQMITMIESFSSDVSKAKKALRKLQKNC